ncbi:MAG: hypothetical protein EOP92_41645, partial [Lysobacteraceae bacterium]
LPDGVWELTVRQVDGSGNRSAVSAPLALTIDSVTPAAPSAPALASGSDTGYLADRTSDNSPTLSGVVEAHAAVQVYDGAALVATVTADASGLWSATLGSATALTEGVHSLTVKQIDRAGNASTASPALALTIDTTAPGALSAPDLDQASDSGSSSTDNITNDATPTFSGGGALAGAEVALILGSSEIGRATADASGNWSITSSALANGAHQVRVRQFDLAGNQGPDSDPLSVTIDTVGPVLTAFYNDRTLKQFELMFSEKIVFHSDGVFTLLRNDNVRRTYSGDNDSNWDIVEASGGKRVLILDIGMNGTFNLSLNNENAIQDMAGNAAEIIGTPSWEPSPSI